MQMAPLTSSPLLSTTEWNKLFSKKEFKNYQKAIARHGSVKKFHHIKNHSLKYFILFGKSLEELIELIEGLTKDKSSQLNSTYTVHQLTALTIAVMRNNIPAIEALVKAGASLEIRDRYGFMPLHHAALISNDLVLRLLRLGADSKSKTYVGATFTHIMRMTGQAPSTKSFDNVWCRMADNALCKISLPEFTRLHHLRLYTDCPYYPPEKIKELWMVSSKEIDPSNAPVEEVLERAYHAMVKVPPKLIVGTDPFLSSQMGRESSHIDGLFAGEDLKFFQGIVEYSGQVTEEKRDFFEVLLKQQDQSKYRLDDLEATEICTVGHFANEGWPNASMMAVFNEGGRQWRSFLIVIDPEGIKSEQGIYWDYGVGEPRLKWNSCYAFAESDAMRRFFEINSLDSLFEQYSELNDRIKNCIAEGKNFDLRSWQLRESIEIRLRFVYSTPAAVIDLVCNKCIQLEKLSLLIQIRSPFLQPLYDQSPTHMRWMEKLIDLMEEFESSLATLSKIESELEQQIRELILGMQGKITTLQIIESIKQINETIQYVLEQPDPSEFGNSYLDELKKKIEMTQPKEDCYPLGPPVLEGGSINLKQPLSELTFSK